MIVANAESTLKVTKVTYDTKASEGINLGIDLQICQIDTEKGPFD